MTALARAMDRVAVLGAAIALQVAAGRLIAETLRRRTPGPRLHWILRRARTASPAGSRWLGVAPLITGLGLMRVASWAGAWRPRRRAGRLLAFSMRAILLSWTFDATGAFWRAARIQRDLDRDDLHAAADEVEGWTARALEPFDESAIVAETIGRLADAPAVSVIGPWTAYALLDVPGAVSYAVAEHMQDPASGDVLPSMVGALRGRQLAWVHDMADEAAALATFLAAGFSWRERRADWQSSSPAAGAPLAVRASARVLQHRLRWDGVSVGSGPMPGRAELRRARWLGVRVLTLLGGTAAVVTVIATFVRDAGAAPEDLAEQLAAE